MALLRRKRADPKVTIQLDKDYIVFQGSPQEALGVYLSGTLAIQSREWAPVTCIRLHLRGLRISFQTGRRRGADKDEFFKRTWDFLEPSHSTGTVIGEYCFPFHVVLEGSLPETVEGLKEASITYSLTAEIVYRGRILSIQKPLRVIRVPQPQYTDMILDQVWKEKLACRVHIPNRLVAFGTSIYLACAFAPLVKGLKIEHIESQLLEFKELGNGGSMASSIISSDRYTFEDRPSCENRRYQCSRRLGFPSGNCVQDVDVVGINVSHKLRVIVRMHNPDGHDSEVRLTVPVTIYLSPSWPVWHDVSIATRLPRPITDCSDEAPPPYGKHELDRLCQAF
ncbi:hypothetical protein BDV18DRAFT_161027 [Aspergillus unguis]